VKVLRKKKAIPELIRAWLLNQSEVHVSLPVPAQIRKIATSQRRAHTEIPSVACKGGRQVAHRESPKRHFYQIQMLFNPFMPPAAQNRGLMKGTWSSFLSYHEAVQRYTSRLTAYMLNVTLFQRCTLACPNFTWEEEPKKQNKNQITYQIRNYTFIEAWSIR